MIFSKDPDDLHGEEVTAYLQIAVRRNGAMSVAGCIENEQYAIAMLDAAKDSIRNHNARRRLQQPQGLIIPANETPLYGNAH